jgi:hypothetical protein
MPANGLDLAHAASDAPAAIAPIRMAEEKKDAGFSFNSSRRTSAKQ